MTRPLIMHRSGHLLANSYKKKGKEKLRRTGGRWTRRQSLSGRGAATSVNQEKEFSWIMEYDVILVKYMALLE